MNVSKFFFHLLMITLFLVAQSTSVKAEGAVTAVFKIESDFFASLIPAETIAEIERNVATALAGQAQSRFPFLNWQTPQNAANDENILTLKLLDIAGGACDPTPTIRLQWSSRVQNNAELALFPKDLYLTCDPDIPVFEPERLQQDIIDALTEKLKGDVEHKKIVNRLVSNISFANRLINHEDKVLLLPIGSANLGARKEAEVTANFSVSDGQTTFLREVVMKPHSYEINGNAAMNAFEVDAQALPNQDNDAVPKLDPLILNIISEHIALEVFMTSHFPDADPVPGGLDELD